MTDRVRVFLVGFVVTLALMLLVTQALGDTPRKCHDFFDNYVGPVVDARDASVPPEILKGQLMMVGIPEDMAFNIIGMVYVVHEDRDKEFIEQDYLNYCLGQAL